MTVFQQIPLIAVMAGAHGIDRQMSSASDEGKNGALSFSIAYLCW